MSLSGQVIAITGKLCLGSRNDIQTLVEANGGKFASAVKKGVTHLVTNTPTIMTSKLESAKKLGVKIVGEDHLASLSTSEPPAKKQKLNQPEIEYNANCLAGIVFAIDGELKMFTKEDCIRFIAEHDGKFSESISPDVTHVITQTPSATSNNYKYVSESFIGDLMTAQFESLFGADDLAPKPKRQMTDGEAIDIQGGSGSYQVRYRNGIYYCTCMAWKMQNQSGNVRSCKHLRDILGAEFETWRTKSNGPVAKSSSSASKSTSSPSKASAPKLLLAHKYDPNINVLGWHISEKFDGVRGYWNGNTFLSRLGNPFEAPDFFTQGLPTDISLDGELFLGRKQFEATISIVKNGHPDNAKNWKQIKFMVFDVPSMKDSPFETRLSYLKAHLASHPYVTVVDHTICTSQTMLEEELKRVEALGAEGLMLRQPKSKYIGSRSNTLLKVKSFSDDEAKVVGYEAGQGKYKGRTGSLKCITRS
ncbi:ATPdependent DNA ligase domain containing protein, partial [Thraustotheca clavata]